MDSKVFSFIEKHRIAVLTTLLEGNKPHSAALHFAVTNDPFSILFLTERYSRKCQNLKPDAASPSSLVIGFSEEEWVTFQAEGTITLLHDKDELEKAWNVYSLKYPGSEKHKTSPESVVLKFVPNSWKYTEVKPDPMKVITSED